MTKLNQKAILTEEIHKTIREQIMAHQLKAGEKINIDQMARTLGVSIIPIREALSRLISEGLVNLVPYKGMFVTHMSLKDLNELFEIRMHLEPLAVDKAALLIPETRLMKHALMMADIKEARSSEDTDSLKKIEQMNESIHGVILDYCGNETLKHLIEDYISRIQRYLRFIRMNVELDFSDLEWKEHNDILQKLIQRDSKAAAEAMYDHLTHSHKRTSAFFK